MRMSAHKKFVLELRAPVERYETRSAAGCKPGTAREDDLGQMLEKKFDELFGPAEPDKSELFPSTPSAVKVSSNRTVWVPSL